MMPGRCAALGSLAAACMLEVSRAGVWGTQPTVAVSGDYATNPALLSIPNTAETHAALLVDAPTSYTGDAFKFSILPSFRLGNTQGYSSLDSNYGHLNVSSEFDTERSILTATGSLARDSSVYYDYLRNGSTGVRRDAASIDLNWDRRLTERVDFDSDVDSTRVNYGQSLGAGTLIDYKYTSLSATLGWTMSERGKVTFGGAVGRYDSLDGTTESSNANLQLGYIKQLSELWTLTASLGYSRADDQIHSYEQSLEETAQGPSIVLIPFTEKTSQNGSVYSVNLSRQTPLWLFTAAASRQLAPTGLAFLSSQDVYELRATYNANERLSFAGDAHRVSYRQPAASGVTALDFNTTYLQLTCGWRSSEYWTISLTGTRVMESYVSSSLAVASNAVSLSASRQFNWKSLQ